MILTNPKVSIIMPCFNRIYFLEKAINSILNQTYKNLEFIIVDDCSELETVELLKKYENLDKRIKLLFNKKNRGPTYSFNKGLFFSKGNFIARMDSDDISHPNRIKKQLEYLIRNPTIFVVGTAVNLINEKDKIIRTLYFKQERKHILEDLKYTNPLVNSSYMANTDKKTKKLLYLKQVFYPADDYYSWHKIIKDNYKLINMNEILLDYRVHESESFTKSRIQGLKTLLVQKIFNLERKQLNIKTDTLRSLDQIKLFLNNLPSSIKPSFIELLYYEFNDTNEIFKEKYWLLKIMKSFFYIRGFKDIFLYFKFIRHFLSEYKNNYIKKFNL